MIRSVKRLREVISAGHFVAREPKDTGAFSLIVPGTREAVSGGIVAKLVAKGDAVVTRYDLAGLPAEWGAA